MTHEHRIRMLEHLQSLVGRKAPGLFDNTDTPQNTPELKGENVNVNDAFSSKYIKHSDLNGKRIGVVIARVTVETVGQGEEARKKPVLYFQGKEKGLALNKTNALTVTRIVGSPETDNWIGKKIVLFPDVTMFGGKQTDCVRIAPMPQGQQPAAPPPPPPVDEEVSDVFGDDSDSSF